MSDEQANIVEQKPSKRAKAKLVPMNEIMNKIDDLIMSNGSFMEFESHARSANSHPKGATLDIYIHEDMDELQALDIDDLAEDINAAPMARISFMGMRGRGRLRLMNLLCTALNNAGFSIRHKGITRFQ